MPVSRESGCFTPLLPVPERRAVFASKVRLLKNFLSCHRPQGENIFCITMKEKNTASFPAVSLVCGSHLRLVPVVWADRQTGVSSSRRVPHRGVTAVQRCRDTSDTRAGRGARAAHGSSLLIAHDLPFAQCLFLRYFLHSRWRCE